MLNTKINPGDMVRLEATREIGFVCEEGDGNYTVAFPDGDQKVSPDDLCLDELFPFYVTYGVGSNLNGKYSVVWAPSYTDARLNIDQVTGGKFAFVYDERQFYGKAEKYGLSEIPLQPQVLDALL